MADYAGAVTAPAVPAELPRISQDTLRRWALWLPMAAILVGQGLLTLRLLHMSTASGDEGRYIYAGHQLIHELWHGGGSPYYETFFSGAPVVYPVLAAIADHLGGVIAVRMMSMAFMLTATCLLFGSGRRLFGYWAGIGAAGLFAGLGLTQDLGALATHDALALMLTAAAAYCAIRTSDAEPHASRWLVLVPVALLAANAAKYATLLFDPVVIAIAACQVTASGWRRMAQRVAALGATTAAVLLIAAFLAGRAYINGILFSTLERKAGTSAVFATQKVAPTTIMGETLSWVGVVLVLGAAAVLVAAWRRADRQRALLLAVLVAGGLLVTAEDLRLHTLESMRKHDDIGIWFTCMAAGYLLARPRMVAAGRTARMVLAAAVPLAVIASGAWYSPKAHSTYEAATGPVRQSAFATIKPYLQLPAGRYLIGGLDNEQMVYTDHVRVPWYRLFDDVYIKYPVPGRGGDSHGQAQGRSCLRPRPGCMYLEGMAGFRAAIRAHWFALISMVGTHHIRQDAEIEAAVRADHDYVLLTTVGGQPTWVYRPAYRHSGLPGMDPVSRP
jgi:4-amino-4-deoxy-L-arabinose transferase-like glycosyltransferase